MIDLINPTGRGIRSDSEGDGHWQAKRGDRRHKGIDLFCDPGQDILSPIKGFIMRIAYPYADDLSWKGIVIQGDWCRIKMYYLDPFVRIGRQIIQGEVIGKAQNISLRYGDKMRSHVHLEFEEIIPNPELYLV